MSPSFGALRNAHSEMRARFALVAPSVKTGIGYPWPALSTRGGSVAYSGSATDEQLGPRASRASDAAARLTMAIPSSSVQWSSEYEIENRPVTPSPSLTPPLRLI